MGGWVHHVHRLLHLKHHHHLHRELEDTIEEATRKHERELKRINEELEDATNALKSEKDKGRSMAEEHEGAISALTKRLKEAERSVEEIKQQHESEVTLGNESQFHASKSRFRHHCLNQAMHK